MAGARPVAFVSYAEAGTSRQAGGDRVSWGQAESGPGCGATWGGRSPQGPCAPSCLRLGEVAEQPAAERALGGGVLSSGHSPLDFSLK
jgi:hypothetical protein